MSIQPISFKALIFDMDGTILDSLTFWHEYERYVMRELGLELVLDENHVIPTGSMYARAASYVNSFGFSYTAADMRNMARNIAPRYYHEEVTVKPYVVDFLQYVRSIGVPLAIATATCLDVARDALDFLKLAPLFDDILSCDTTGIGKREPDVYLRAAASLGADVSNAFVFEDNYICVRTAAQAGFTTVGVADRCVSEENQKLAAESATFFIHGFDEALDNVKSGRWVAVK